MIINMIVYFESPINNHFDFTNSLNKLFVKSNFSNDYFILGSIRSYTNQYYWQYKVEMKITCDEVNYFNFDGFIQYLIIVFLSSRQILPFCYEDVTIHLNDNIYNINDCNLWGDITDLKPFYNWLLSDDFLKIKKEYLLNIPYDNIINTVIDEFKMTLNKSNDIILHGNRMITILN